MVLGLREGLLGQRVHRVRVLCDRLLGQTSPSALRRVRGGRVIGLHRKGKFLLFHLSNGSLLVFHLRMTGKLVLVPSASPLSSRDPLRLDFSEWEWALSFEDTRRFGSLDILHGCEAVDGLLSELGPDALIVGLEDFRELLAESRRPVKALLLDQRVIAGLGNIYVDESLHRAGVMGSLNVSTSFQYALGLCGVFVGVFLFLSAVNHLVIKPMAWKRALDRRLARKRREQLSQVQILKNASEDKKSLVAFIAKQLAGLGKIENFQRSLLQADIYWRPETFLAVSGLLACFGFAGGLLYKGNYPLGLGLGAVLGYLPFIVVRAKRQRKANLFEAQMPNCMDLLAR